MNWTNDVGHLFSRESPITVGPGIDQICGNGRVCPHCKTSRPVYVFFGDICNICKFPPLNPTINTIEPTSSDDTWSD